jgi:hypothetical protein
MTLNMANQKSIDGLVEMFEINKKSALERHCTKLTIYAKDFANIVLLADQGMSNYHHNKYCREIVPKDLRSTLDALPKIQFDSMSADRKSNLLKRLVQVIKVRRQLVGHMFFDKDVNIWHFFYFDQRDTSKDGNHWNYGSHVHFINFLWPNHDPVYVLKDFLDDNPKLKGSLHIRFIDK